MAKTKETMTNYAVRLHAFAARSAWFERCTFEPPDNPTFFWRPKASDLGGVCQCCGSRAMRFLEPIRSAEGKMYYVGGNCIEALWDTGKIRNGHLAQREWPKIRVEVKA